MDNLKGKTFVVTGATGRQGSAVVRHLIRSGAQVRGLTRSPWSEKAKRVENLGAEMVAGDMGNPDLLRRLFEGAAGVYSVQNPHTSSIAEEIQQGKNVADAAKAAGVPHVIQASAGTGKKTGIPSWDSKLEIQAYFQSLGLPLTVLRPTTFMELITDKAFYPSVSTFHLMPKLLGPDKKLPWIAVDDLGVIVARVFADPEKYKGKDLTLASDLQSIHEVRKIYQEVKGRKAPSFPMPLFLFRMFTGKDLIIMWNYLRTATLDITPQATYDILSEAQTIPTWLAKQK